MEHLKYIYIYSIDAVIISLWCKLLARIIIILIHNDTLISGQYLYKQSVKSNKKTTLQISTIDSLRSASFLRAAAVFSSELFVEETAKDMRSFSNIFVGCLQQQVPERRKRCVLCTMCSNPNHLVHHRHTSNHSS